MSTLTQTEAKEFGKALRWIRDARQMPLREVSAETGVSYQYLHNIEAGTRFNKATGTVSAVDPSPDILEKIQRCYRLPDHALDDLLLRARVRSVLDMRGISRSDADAAWRMLETRLGELGTPIHTDLAQVVAGILGQPQAVRTRRQEVES
jgi:transcriptional regulator with XRE-family HTH domain